MLLVDTNVISELRKVQHHRTDPNFVTWATSVHIESLYLSVVTLHELEVGVLRIAARDPLQGQVLRRWTSSVMEEFSVRILPVDTAIALRAAQLSSTRTRSLADDLIAATAYVHRLKIVTRNTSDFEDAGIELINPWNGSLSAPTLP